jgi:hypothetical protein
MSSRDAKRKAAKKTGEAGRTKLTLADLVKKPDGDQDPRQLIHAAIWELWDCSFLLTRVRDYLRAMDCDAMSAMEQRMWEDQLTRRAAFAEATALELSEAFDPSMEHCAKLKTEGDEPEDGSLVSGYVARFADRSFAREA